MTLGFPLCAELHVQSSLECTQLDVLASVFHCAQSCMCKAVLRESQGLLENIMVAACSGHLQLWLSL